MCVCPGGSGSNMESRLILDAQAGYLRGCVCVQVGLCVCPDGSGSNIDSRLYVCVFPGGSGSNVDSCVCMCPQAGLGPTRTQG